MELVFAFVGKNPSGVPMKKSFHDANRRLKTTAELLEVLRRNGYEADSPYAFENFLQDHGTSEVIARILCGEHCDDDNYTDRPIADRLADFHKLPKETP